MIGYFERDGFDGPFVIMTRDNVPTDRTLRDSWQFDPVLGIALTLSTGQVLYRSEIGDHVTITTGAAHIVSGAGNDRIETGGSDDTV